MPLQQSFIEGGVVQVPVGGGLRNQMFHVPHGGFCMAIRLRVVRARHAVMYAPARHEMAEISGSKLRTSIRFEADRDTHSCEVLTYDSDHFLGRGGSLVPYCNRRPSRESIGVDEIRVPGVVKEISSHTFKDIRWGGVVTQTFLLLAR